MEVKLVDIMPLSSSGSEYENDFVAGDANETMKYS